MCTGYARNIQAAGESGAALLNEINSRFCGCTHITGNLWLNFVNVQASELNEDFFSAFYYLEELEGYFILENVPAIDRVLFPSLHLIRGKELLPTSGGDQLALVIRESSIGKI